MLRRRLLLILGSMMLLVGGTLIVSILLLQKVLGRLDQVHLEAQGVLEEITRLRWLAAALAVGCLLMLYVVGVILRENEKRRLETLGLAALTLNHELNNVMAMIEMQLQLLGRRAAGGEGIEKSLHNIHDGLNRMSNSVESLKHIKRIVLTDYIEGTKMLDLERCTQREPSA